MKNKKPLTFQTESFICQKRKIIFYGVSEEQCKFCGCNSQKHNKKSVGNMQIHNINETGNIVKLGWFRVKSLITA